MKYAKFFPISILLIAVALREIGIWCIYKQTSCSLSPLFHSTLSTFINPLYTFSITSIAIVVLVLFIRRDVFRLWLSFAVWWIPLSIILITLEPENSNAWMPLFFYGKNQMASFMAIGFTIISLILIAWKTLATRRLK